MERYIHKLKAIKKKKKNPKKTKKKEKVSLSVQETYWAK